MYMTSPRSASVVKPKSIFGQPPGSLQTLQFMPSSYAINPLSQVSAITPSRKTTRSSTSYSTTLASTGKEFRKEENQINEASLRIFFLNTETLPKENFNDYFCIFN